MGPAAGLLWVLGGFGTLVAVASSSSTPIKKTPPLPPPAPSKTRSYAIGGGLPQPTLEQVINTLRDGTPAQLEALAKDLEKQFPMAAAGLRQRAAEFGPGSQVPETRGADTAPAVAQPAPTAPATFASSGILTPATAAPLDAPPANAKRLPETDPGMTPEWQSAIWGALVTEVDPDTLRGMANHIKDVYPIASSLLLAKAAKLITPGAQIPTGAPSSPPAIQAGLEFLDPAMPLADQKQLIQVMQNETNPVELRRLANEIAARYPLGAGALLLKATHIEQQSPSPSAPKMAPVSWAPPSSAPLAAPAPLADRLDPSMPPEVAAEVRDVLLNVSDPALLRGLASKIATIYPLAAGAILVKASSLDPPSPRAPAPKATPSSAPVAAPASPVSWESPSSSPATPSPVPSAPVAQHAPPSAAEAARRNAGRPQGYPYITLRGESTYPAQIAKEATGNEMNYSQLSAINPQFVKDGAHWMNIQIGDEINIPAAWTNALAARYHVTDPSAHGGMANTGLGGAHAAQGGGLGNPHQLVGSDLAPAAPTPTQQPVAAAPTAAPPALALVPSATPPTPIQNLPNAVPPHVSGDAIPMAYHPSPSPGADGLSGGTYVVKPGDFPIKIAKTLVGDGNLWHELVAANPGKKTKADGNFATLLPGEKLQLPASWSTAAAGTSVAMLGGAHVANA